MVGTFGPFPILPFIRWRRFYVNRSAGRITPFEGIEKHQIRNLWSVTAMVHFH